MKIKILSHMPLFVKILLILAILIAAVVIVISIFASKNTKAMNEAIEAVLSEISSEHKVTPIDPAPYSELTVYKVMKFHVDQYDVEGVGNLSVMKVNMGFMQMATVVLTPTDKNLPLVSSDYMYQFGKRTAYLEFYDTVLEPEATEYQDLLKELKAVKRSYNALEDTTPTPAWYDNLKTVGIYKTAKAADDPTLNEILCKGFRTVLDAGDALPTLEGDDRQAKAELCKEYSDGLIKNGGISTDVFKKELGEETTRDFFDQVFFGTNRALKAN